ncbi:MAG: tRNA (N6-isopentenyl adenosine(37)-C2)-methylthiotransferase MiaB [Acidobacteria bacterium]|nr:tRNA (N6-isopentenyl adenosine(37)-C2)-methylthiotransferase MiaB [Acidobacteriota bacterium]MBI3422878.1 tRNA (N6-isopentenyl adenosine(37)-C2)-methylthiotransferase MiaB [Acidobacteriota bacterium]
MKKLYLETFGCQMNVHDSEKAAFILGEAGYELTEQSAEADLILLNTCMVREKAARKVYSRIGEFKSARRKQGTKKPLPIFGVMGCVAQAEADRLFARSQDVRLVLGTQAISKLPELVGQLEQGFPRAIDVRLSKDAEFFELQADSRLTEHIAYLTITEGCNKFCSFCIVPFTRGRERSRSADSIVEEASRLAGQGYKEIHLLGQNVNSYGLSGRLTSSLSQKNQALPPDQVTFARLLERVALESGVPRIKFTTSYPRDFGADIVSAIEKHHNLCAWVHLPVQSGSDRVLRAMRRGYTRKDYLEKIALMRNSKLDFSITGDIIIGFPGETEEDFQQTLSLVAEVEYDGLYIFKYSPRPKTPAATYTDTVAEETKTDRFVRLQELQSRIQKQRYARYLGKVVEVLVEGESVRSDNEYTGHTRCNKVVNFPKTAGALGELVQVVIDGVSANSLRGVITLNSEAKEII